MMRTVIAVILTELGVVTQTSSEVRTLVLNMDKLAMAMDNDFGTMDINYGVLTHQRIMYYKGLCII